MAWTRAALALVAAVAVALVLVSGGSSADPRTPAGLPGLPAPFLGTATVGSGGLTAAIDAYGDVVDLRAPGPAGAALIDNPADRQAAGSVAADTGIVPRIRIEGGAALPLWHADSVFQRYLPGTNVVRTVARFGPVTVAITDAAIGEELARIVEVRAPAGTSVEPALGVNIASGARCERAQRSRGLTLICFAGHLAAPPGRNVSSPASEVQGNVTATAGTEAVTADPRRIVRAAIGGDRRWLARARQLGPAAPAWARRMYRRSLLTLRALTDRRTGALAAGARDGWAYVWPRDAGTAALAFAAAGYLPEARQIARFLLGLDLGVAARFRGNGTPLPGRGPQGDASGWVAIAARAAGLHRPAAATAPTTRREAAWRGRPDYQEGAGGDYLANAIASAPPTGDVSELFGHMDAQSSGTSRGSRHRPFADRIERAFGTARGLVRRAGEQGSGLDSAAAWAVRPFALPALYPNVCETLLGLAARQTRFGITPGEGWPGSEPWSAPTAWTAWSLAALADVERRSRTARSRAGGERRQALRLLGDLRRAATPAGALPERVNARTGTPRSTTPLAWSHAFAILALRQLWPGDDLRAPPAPARRPRGPRRREAGREPPPWPRARAGPSYPGRPPCGR